MAKKVIIFWTDMSSSAHANNKKRSVLVLGKNFIQGIEAKTIYAEKIYSPNFTVNNKTFCLSLHIMMIIVIYLSTVKNLLILKPKTLKLSHIHYV